MPAIERDGADSLDELVTMSAYESEIGRSFSGDFELRIGNSPVEELTRLQPREPIARRGRDLREDVGHPPQCPARVRTESMRISTGVRISHGSRSSFIPICAPMRGGTMSSPMMMAMP